MCNDDHAYPEVADDLDEEIVQSLGVGVVQVAGGLVCQYDARLGRESSRDGRTLLLTSTQLGRPMVQAFRQPHASKQRAGPLLGFGRAPTSDPERKRNVFKCRKLAQQVVKLENESDPPVAHRGEFLIRATRKAALRKKNFARRRAVEAAKYVHQGALARSALADDGQHLTGLDTEIDAAEHVERHSVAANVPLCNAAAFENRRHSERIASTGYSFAACIAGYRVASAAISRLATTIIITSRGCVVTGRWSMK